MLPVRAWAAPLLLACSLLAAGCRGEDAADTSTPAADGRVDYFFFNEQTGRSQWEDPGDAPWLDDEGRRFFLDHATGGWSTKDSAAARYRWQALWSEPMNRHYYQDVQQRASVWLKPIDLAWRRVAVESIAGIAIAPPGAPGAAVVRGPPPPTREEAAALLGEGESGGGGDAVDPIVRLLTQRMEEVEKKKEEEEGGAAAAEA